jgi:hypothetical protein
MVWAEEIFQLEHSFYFSQQSLDLKLILNSIWNRTNVLRISQTVQNKNRN